MPKGASGVVATGLSMSAKFAIGAVVAVVVVGVVIGVLFATGVLGGGETAATPAPTVGVTNVPTATTTLVTGAAPTVTTSPNVTVTSISPNTALVLQNATGTLPVTQSITLAGGPYTVAPTVNISSVSSLLRAGSAVVYALNSVSTTAASITVNTVGGSASPTVGNAVTGSNATSDTRHDLIRIAQINGVPALCYYTTGTQSYQYVLATNTRGSAWNTPVSLAGSVINTGYNGTFLTTQPNGQPVVGYLPNGNAPTIVNSGSAFNFTGATNFTFTAGNSANGPMSLLKFSGGNLGLCYWNNTPGTSAIFAYTSSLASPLTSSNFTSYTLVNGVVLGPGGCTMGMVNGFAAVLYATSGGMMYSVSTGVQPPTSAGQFGTAVNISASNGYDTVQNGGNLELMTITVLVNGTVTTRPIAIWSSISSKFVFFTIANDATGASWPGTLTRVDSTQAQLMFDAMQMPIGGAVGCVYVNADFSLNFAYITATATSTTTAATPTVRNRRLGSQNCYNGGSGGSVCGIGMVNSVPCIAFANTSNVVQFVHAGLSSNETFDDAYQVTYTVA